MSVRKLFLMAACAGLMALRSPAAEQAVPQKIGIYDSRSIALVYTLKTMNSPEMKQKIAATNAEYAQLKAAGDAKKLAAFEAPLKAEHLKQHQQVFGTAPVDECLAAIKDKTPELMKKANVSVMISKWDKETLAKYKGATQVDMTEALIDAFAPTPKDRATAIDLQKHKPVSNEQLKNDND